MPEIQQLSANVVNKIAAGEVIERPASVVKELVENSIDAGATRIDVAIEKGGTELIRVVDDGCGIPAGQVALAVAPHATSKIRSADDLFSVGTLGFRGEALASIAEVSRFLLRTRTHDADGGSELSVQGGHAAEPAPCGCPPGTAIEVRQVLFNTPARRKFLKTTQTEMGHISEAFSRLALANPHIHFTLQHGHRRLHDLPPTDRWVERIAALYGHDLAEKLIWIESCEGEVTLRGYVAHPSESRSHNRMQYVFLNRRYIRDRALQHALGEAYRGLLLTGRYPVVFLSLEMPPELVDVNVHPTKLEVRFQESGRHYSQLLSTIRTRFLGSDLTHAVDDGLSAGPSDALDERAEQAREELSRWAQSQLGGPQSESAAAVSTLTALQLADVPSAPSCAQSEFPELRTPPRAPLELVPLTRAQLASQQPPQRAAKPADETETAPPAGPSRPSLSALQICNRYLVTEAENGVAIIDQHALHERVLYEQLRERVLAGSLETQKLLVPETVDLTAEEAAAAVENQALLAQLGLQVEPFGDSTVAVGSYPAMLKGVQPEELLRDLVAALVSDRKKPDRRDVLDEMLHSMSCRAAVKAGDRLTPEEVTALLEQSQLVQDAHHCPHGRPTALVFTREELDKRFLRT